MPLLHYAFADKSAYFDLFRGWRQIVDHKLVLGLSVAICFSIAAFNLCGLGVTKAVSASARSVAMPRPHSLVVADSSTGSLQINNRYMSNPLHLGGLPLTRLGTSLVAIQRPADHGIRSPGVRSLSHSSNFPADSVCNSYGTFVFNGLVKPIIFAPDPSELSHLPHEEVLDTTAVVPAAQRQGRIGYDVVPIDEEDNSAR
jgi:hypothetical protein